MTNYRPVLFSLNDTASLILSTTDTEQKSESTKRQTFTLSVLVFSWPLFRVEDKFVTKLRAKHTNMRRM